EVSNLSALLKAYWGEIKDQNRIAQDNTGLAIEINTQASFLTLDIQMEEKIQDMGGIALCAAKRLNGIWDEIIVFMKKNGVDTSKIESIPYYENPLYNPDWETINIGLPNAISYLNLISTQMAIKHYE